MSDLIKITLLGCSGFFVLFIGMTLYDMYHNYSQYIELQERCIEDYYVEGQEYYENL